ncbi:ATP-binding cassette domain-containing protein, partial [Oenococcus oeni]
MLKIDNLTKTLENKKVISGISFSLKPSQIVGLIGRNGVGKTTLFRLISGEYVPDQGRVTSDESADARSEIFYLDSPDNFTNAFT